MTDSFNQPGFLNFVVAQYSGARPWIADYSGLPIETVEWSGQRYLKSWISGQHVDTNVTVQVSGVTATISVSGNPVLISGQTVYLVSGQNAVQVSGQPVQISGQTVYPVSGKAFAYGFDPSGSTWNELWVNASGGHDLRIAGSFTANVSGQPVNVSGNAVRISGDTIIALISGQTVVASVTTNISGQTVYLVSGNNAVQNSGQAVRISGETVQIAGGINVSGSPVRISGETIYPVSGLSFTKVFDPSGTQWLDAWVNASGAHRILVSISGETILGSVSGNMVSVSGQPVAISGSMVSISGQPVSVSGNALRISGQTVIGEISGQTIVVPSTSISGNVVQISGAIVYPVSGFSFNKVFDPSGATWNDWWVDASGSHRPIVATSVSGQLVAVSGLIATSVSGNMVSISGQPVSISGNMVSISGQPVSVSGNAVVISGQTIVVPSTSISGNAVRISGETVYPVSGKAFSYIFDPSGNQWLELWNNASGSHNLAITAQVETNISGQTVYPVSGKAFAYGFDPSGQTWNELWVSQSGGHDLRIFGSLSANVSGNVVYLVSGQNNVQISGQLVAVSGLVATSVSGNMVSVSGQPVSVSGNMVSVSGQPVTVSGNVVNTSGNVNFDFGTVIRTTSGTIVTSLSGGTELGSGIVINVTVRNLSGNGPMYIGGTGTEAPFSGKGMILFGNESQTYDIDNFNKIRLFANTSGQRVRVIGVAAN